MGISELIKYEGDNSTFIWKYPNEDFNCMTELLVHESQEAIFFANGQVADIFGPGRYKLDAKNIPILTKLLDTVTGVSIFHCEVYFINKTVQMAVKWGTDSKVRFNEPTLGVPVELGASGEMNIGVSDGKKLLLKLVGTMNGIAWGSENDGFTKSLQASFKPLISTGVKANLASVIKQKEINVVEIDEYLTVLSDELKTSILSGFEEYGLTIHQFYCNNIVPTEDENFKRLRELHTITLQKRLAEAEAEVRSSQAESRATYMTAEAEADAKIKAAQRESILEGQTTETEIARREAERKLIQAQADAQATQIAGMAEAAVMREQGYNHKDVLQAEVQKAYAEGIGNMGATGSSGGGNSMLGDMVGLGVGMAAMGAMAPQVGEMMKGFNVGGTVNSENTNVFTVKCVKCGSMLPENAKFCLECGTKMEKLADDEMLCPHCGKKSMKGKFCMECGESLVKVCPTCGRDIIQGSKFCLDCGTKLV